MGGTIPSIGGPPFESVLQLAAAVASEHASGVRRTLLSANDRIGLQPSAKIVARRVCSRPQLREGRRPLAHRSEGGREAGLDRGTSGSAAGLGSGSRARSRRGLKSAPNTAETRRIAGVSAYICGEWLPENARKYRGKSFAADNYQPASIEEHGQDVTAGVFHGERFWLQ